MKNRTWNGDGLGQRTCWADNCLDLQLGKHSCNRSWMADREAASSLLHGRAEYGSRAHKYIVHISNLNSTFYCSSPTVEI